MRLIRLLKKDLAMEAADWVDKDLISADQARGICKAYDVDFDSVQNSSMACWFHWPTFLSVWH